MAPKSKSKSKVKAEKPILVQVGRHFINPSDVAAIRRVEIKKRETNYDVGEDEAPFSSFTTTRVKTMYVVDMKSNPNPNYAIWVEEHELEVLLDEFVVKS